MRILNVNSLIDPVLGGGTAERTVQMTRALISRGHFADVLALDIGDGVRSQHLPSPAEFVILKSLNDRFQVPRTSIKWLRKLVAGYQVVHLMGHWSILNAMVAAAASLEGIPYVVCPAGALPVFGRSRILKRFYNRLVGYKLIRQAKAHIAVTHDERQHFAEYGVDLQAVHVIPNGIDLDDYLEAPVIADSVAKGTPDAPYILFMGRLNFIKGPDLLLEAFASIEQEIPRFHLVFAGPDGGLLKTLRARVDSLALKSRVHFPGFLFGSRKVDAFRRATVLVIPSRSDAMSIVVLEASACGLPVVLTDQCGFNEVQTIGGGIVVKTNAHSIADALRRLIALERDVLSGMGKKLRSFATSHYTWSSVIGQYIAVYAAITVTSKE